MKSRQVNYIQHLSSFFIKIYDDDRLNPNHISLYMALFQCWNLNRFQTPISLSRMEVMRLAKIASPNSYSRYIKELDQFGYIEYKPSFNPSKGSVVNLFIFNNGDDKAKSKSNNTAKRTKTIQLNIPSINSINKTNKINTKNIESANSHLPSKQKKINKKIVFEIPTISELENFFMENHHSVLEANRFFNHFQSNGWLIGGRSKMKDWKAAARNWMSRSKEYNKTTDTNPLSTEIKKDYSEPL